jgi:hypothetical protein
MIYMGRASRIVRNHQPKKRHVIINLVAMIDMLTVLVFFLLVYSTEQITAVPDRKEVQLPESISETEITNTVFVVVGGHDIVVPGRPVGRMAGIPAPAAPFFTRKARGGPARVDHMKPGTYTACAVPLPGDPRNPTVAQQLLDQVYSLPMKCAPVTIGGGEKKLTITVPAAWTKPPE